LRRDRRPEEYREALGQVLSELERTSTLIEDLRMLGSGDAGLSADTTQALETLTRPVHIQVFVTPT